MTTVTILGWLVPLALSLAFAGIFAVVRIWSKQDRHADELARISKQVDKHEERLDEHDGHLSKQAQTLATISEGVEWIKRTLSSAFEIGKAK